MKSDNRKKGRCLAAYSLYLKGLGSKSPPTLVTDLQESEGKTAVAIFVDRLTKMMHFLPCTKEITASRVHMFIRQPSVQATWDAGGDHLRPWSADL